jgi:hypothetical protein
MTASADAGVSPFAGVITPDGLPSDLASRYAFSRYDVVVVLTVADARSITWRGLVTESDGTPVVGLISRSSLPGEVASIIDPQFLTGTMIAVADDRLADDLAMEAIDGPCGHEPDMDGVVQGDLVSGRVETAMRTSLDRAPAVGVGAYGLSGSGVTWLTARQTGADAVSIIEPQFITGDGWCDANPTPHP